jgi:hypothetical protein
MGDFLESIIWSSFDNFKDISYHMVDPKHFKDHLKNNYLISKSNYFISLLIITSFPTNYHHLYNYLILFPYSPTWI